MSRRALIADDTEDMRVLLRLILTSNGWDVPHTTVDGQDAFETWQANAQEIDVMVLDHNMPRMTGLAAATAVRATGADVPIVIVSAYLDDALRQKASLLNITCLDKIAATRLADYLPDLPRNRG